MKPQKVYGRNVENEVDLDGRRKNRREEIVGSVFFYPVYLDNSKKTERVYPLYRVSSEVFIVNIIEPPLGGPL